VWCSPLLRANVYAAGLANFSYGVTWGILLVFAIRTLDLAARAIGLILAIGEAAGALGAASANRIARK
jgi:hypothetical protein